MDKSKLKTYGLFILFTELVGVIAGLFTSTGMDAYDAVEKPALTPPDIVFPIVWTILYALMGVSFYLILNSDKKNKTLAYSFYFAQLFVNFIWSFVFFTLNNYSLSVFLIITLLVLIAGMIVFFYPLNKKAAYLQLPYFLWVCFATYLNWQIFILNQ